MHGYFRPLMDMVYEKEWVDATLNGWFVIVAAKYLF